MNIPINEFEEYLKDKGLSERTIELYLYYFMRFRYDRLNQETIASFFKDKGNRNFVGRGFIKHLQGFLKLNKDKYSIKLEDYQQLIDLELPTIKANQKLIKVINEEDVKLLENSLKSEKDKLMLLLGFYTGIRLAELLNIIPLDFEFKKWGEDKTKMGVLLIRKGKGHKERKVLVPPFLMVRIVDYLRKNIKTVDEYIFIKPPVPLGDYKRLEKNVKAAARLWQRKIKQAGLSTGITKIDAEGNIIESTKVNPHKLRHSYATDLLSNKNIEITELKELMGHKNIQTTQKYTHLEIDNIKKKLETSQA